MNSEKIKKFAKEHRFEIFLFIFSFFLHLAVGAFSYAKFGSSMLSRQNEDALGYLSVGQNLALGRGFMMYDIVSAIRLPAYPLFLSLFYIFHLPLALISFFQIVIFSLSAVLLYLIGKNFFSENTGRFAGLALALEPLWAFTVNLAIAETFFVFLILLFVYFFGQWHLSGKLGVLIASAVFLGLGTLTRPVSSYIVLVVFIFMLLRWLHLKAGLKTHLKAFAFFLILFLAVLSPWLLRQYFVFGAFKISSSDTYMLYTRIAPLAVADKLKTDYHTAESIFLSELPKKIPGFDQRIMEHTFKYEKILRAEAKELIIAHWPAVARFYAMSLSCGLFGTGYDYILEDLGLSRQTERISFTETLLKGEFKKFLAAFFRLDIFQIVLIAGALLWLVFYIFILTGLIYSFVFKEKFLMVFLISLLAAYFIFFSLGPQCHARYRLPGYPFLFLLVGFGAGFIFKKKF